MPHDQLIDVSASPEVLREVWPALPPQERLEGFQELSVDDAQEFFLSLDSRDQAELLHGLGEGRRRLWMRLLAPDDAADVIQESSPEDHKTLLGLFDAATRKEVLALLAYAEDDAGGLMNSRFARLRPDMSVDEAISYLRKQALDRVEKLYYLYVLDQDQTLVGVLSIRELLVAKPAQTVREIMRTEFVTVHDETDQEIVAEVFADYDLAAIPVIDDNNRMVGVITVDDVVDAVEAEVTEDMHKLGGMSHMDAPYLQITLGEMLRKRAPWMVILFLGEMLTATALGRYETQIARATVLATFIPLIIASGGNSGSQATTLLIRALVLGEVRGRNWLLVARRELTTGLLMGLLLGTIGFLRVILWEYGFGIYGEHYMRFAITIGLSLVLVVIWGTLAGSMLPLALRQVGLDPASASAPLVATLVDVTGLLIFFSLATVLLRGAVL